LWLTAAALEAEAGASGRRIQYPRLRSCRCCQQILTPVLSVGWQIIERWKTKGRGRLGASLQRSVRRSHETSLEMSFELSFQRSFDASFRRDFEASDVRSNALSFETSDVRSDVTSIEMSDGRSDEVSFRVSVLPCFPANSETSFLTSFQGCFHARLCREFPVPSWQPPAEERTGI